MVVVGAIVGVGAIVVNGCSTVEHPLKRNELPKNQPKQTNTHVFDIMCTPWKDENAK